MNKIIDKSLLAGGKFMSKLHLKQPDFTYSACGPLTKNHERIKKFREVGNLKHISKNELDKACFAHDAAYSNSKDLAKRPISDQVFKIIAYETARNPGYDGYQRALLGIVYNVFDNKTGLRISVNKQLPEELHKPFTKKSLCKI